MPFSLRSVVLALHYMTLPDSFRWRMVGRPLKWNEGQISLVLLENTHECMVRASKPNPRVFLTALDTP